MDSYRAAAAHPSSVCHALAGIAALLYAGWGADACSGSVGTADSPKLIKGGRCDAAKHTLPGIWKGPTGFSGCATSPYAFSATHGGGSFGGVSLGAHLSLPSFDSTGIPSSCEMRALVFSAWWVQDSSCGEWQSVGLSLCPCNAESALATRVGVRAWPALLVRGFQPVVWSFRASYLRAYGAWVSLLAAWRVVPLVRLRAPRYASVRVLLNTQPRFGTTL